MANNASKTVRSEIGLIADSLDFYAPPILIVVGVLCNSLVILVMRMRCFSNTSTSLYICANAIVDNITLIIAFPVHWIHVSFPELLYRGNNDDIVCKISYFIGWGTSNLGIVLTAAMTMERSIAIKFPLKAHSICTKRKAKFVIVGLVVAVSLKDIHYLIKSKMVSENVLAYLCEIDITSEVWNMYVEQVWPIVQHVFLFLSFTVIIISNVVIITSVREAGTTSLNRSTHDRQSSVNGLQSRTSRTRQITMMLIADSLTIMICTLPLAIYDTIRPEFADVDVAHLVFGVIFYLVYVNRCANFFLYCVSGSRFRQALKMLCIKGDSRRMESIYHITQFRDSTIRNPEQTNMSVM